MRTSGLIMESTKAEMRSVGQPFADTIGRPGWLILWIFGSRYSNGKHGNL